MRPVQDLRFGVRNPLPLRSARSPHVSSFCSGARDDASLSTRSAMAREPLASLLAGGSVLKAAEISLDMRGKEHPVQIEPHYGKV